MKKSTLKILILASLILVLPGQIIYSQECGPSCPACSGSTDGSLLAPEAFHFSTLYLPGGEEERGRLNLRYGVFSWLDLGIGYTIDSRNVIWNARLQALREDEEGWRPGIIIGTGSVKTGGSDQSLYFHITKSWEFSESLALRVTAGTATLFPEFNKVYGLAGITVSLYEKIGLFVNYDGISFHEGVSWIPLNWLTVSVLLVESKEPAISIGIKLSFVKNK